MWPQRQRFAAKRRNQDENPKARKAAFRADVHGAAGRACRCGTGDAYTAAAQGNNAEVKVRVIFEQGAISAVTVEEHAETPGLADPALERIPEAIVANQSVNIDAVSGATNTSKAILNAVKDCIVQAGGAVENFSAKAQVAEDEIVLTDAVEEYEADVVVIGAGGSGSAAAVAASQKGAKVIVLEKSNMVGGSSVMSMGMGAMNSSLQKEDPETDFTAGEWMTSWLKQQNYMVSGPMIYTYITESGPTVDWLMENGFSFDYVGHAQQALMDDPIRLYHLWAGDGFAASIARMLQQIEENGGQTLMQTRATEIIMEDGVARGVIGHKADGTAVKVYADAVIIATGGYGASEEKMEALLGFRANGINSGTQTGDGIDMGVAAGAALQGEQNVEFHGAHAAFDLAAGVPGNGKNLNQMAINPGTLWVNAEGYRFTNEDICYDSSYLGNVTSRQGSQYYILVDQKTVDTLETQGASALGITKDFAGFGAAGYTAADLWENLNQDLTAGLETGVTYKADTLEALADLAGIDKARLLETVTVYNASCEAGVDEMYCKDAQFMIPVKEGPFYLVVGRTTELCTLGGLKINTEMQVLDTQDQVIPGLYAAGVDCSGSLFNNAYVSFEGVTMGWVMTSGRLAGEAAAAHAVQP